MAGGELSSWRTRRAGSGEDSSEDIKMHDQGRNARLEKKLVHKFDRHILPLVFVLYVLAFLDRSNIGNAKIAGMATDLSLHGNRYNWLLTIFYIAYVVAEVTVLFYKIFPPHIWIAICTFFWGVFATAQAGANSYDAMLAFRFVMGVFEAGFGPGITYYLSFFYQRHELGLREGFYLSAAAIATCFSGALAYGITGGHAAIAKWRLLFLVEGLPTICMAPVAFFFIPDTPQSARFLTEDEKNLAIARGIRQTGSERSIGRINPREVLRVFLDIRSWLTALMYFSCNVSFSSLPVFLPTIILEMGFSSVEAQGLSAPQYLVAFLLVLGTCRLADKTQQRGLVIACLAATGGVGYLVLATTTSVGGRYVATFLAAAGVFPAIGNILPWVMNNQGSDARRGAAAVLLNLVGQCGPILGTNVFPAADAPFYVKGQSVCAAFMFLAAALALALRQLNVWENGRLEREYGRVEDGKEGRHEMRGGEDDYGPRFRYVL